MKKYNKTSIRAYKKQYGGMYYFKEKTYAKVVCLGIVNLSDKLRETKKAEEFYLSLPKEFQEGIDFLWHTTLIKD